MMEYFSFEPFLALILIAVSCSLLGVFVLWKKLAYFGDASSHSVLLSLSLGSFFAISQNLVLLIFATIFAILVFFVAKNRYFSKDTMIAIASYFCVSLAIIVNDLSVEKIDFESYVFGDISTIQTSDLYILLAIAIFAIFFTFLNFKKILLINLNTDLAKIKNLRTNLLNVIFLILISLIIALSIKIVGIFLMTALLVLPAAISRLISSNAKQMMITSLLLSIAVCTFSSVVASYFSFSLSAFTILTFCLIFIATILLKKDVG